MKKIGAVEIGLIVAVALIAVLLYANRGCALCKNRQTAISGPWPGAGSGVAERAGNATTAAPVE